MPLEGFETATPLPAPTGFASPLPERELVWPDSDPSGAAAAAAAHAAGAVEPVVELQLFDVTVGFVVQAHDQAGVDELVNELELGLLEYVNIAPPIVVTVAERG